MPDENLPLCACGCGERVSHRPGRINNRYRRGHHMRTAEAKARAAAKRTTPLPPPNPSGLCLCGCGEKTVVRNGRPNRYVFGHYSRSSAGKAMYTARFGEGPEPPNPSGLCLCGCGETTSIAALTDRESGIVKGEHVRFVAGHQNRTRRGAMAYQWKGGRTKKHSGYVRAYAPDHPKANGCYVDEHRLVAESELGRLLRDKEIVHHLNGTRDDNRPENLIVLASTRDHYKLHAWLRAMGIDLDRIGG